MSNFNLNKVILGGRLTGDPELKQVANGASIVSFSIAVNRKYVPKSDDPNSQSSPQADFINIVAWRSTAEFIARYFHKGSSICIVGSIQTRTWTDQQGVKRYATDVQADEAYFVDSKAEGQGQYAAPYAAGGASQYVPDAYSESPNAAPYVASKTVNNSNTDVPSRAPGNQGNQNNQGNPSNFEALADEDDLPF